MKTTNSQLTDLDQDLQKALALKQFNGEDFFILEELAFDGREEDARIAYKEYSEGEEFPTTFKEWALSSLDEIEPIEDDEERDNYIVLTDEEADERAKESIIDSLWAFNPSFLAEQTGLDQEVFEAIQANGKCEDNNDTIYNTIKKLGDIDDFVNAAISSDGRGHFMSSYDGEENEEQVGETTYYIYRMN